MTETELARIIMTDLQRQGFETYEEVSLGYASDRVDIVAVRGPLLAAIECKVNLSMRLLDQAIRWIGYANLVVAAFSYGRVGPALKCLSRAEGIGLWAANGDEIHPYAHPRLLRRVHDRLRRHLNPAQRSGQYAQAGSNGGYWTPFRQTVRELERIAHEQPGIPLREAIASFEHHYASNKIALSSITALIEKGVIMTLRVEGRPMQLYPQQPGAYVEESK